ncbi:MAG TPA: phage tail length tape measure family protein [Stellaceae bacterium]
MTLRYSLILDADPTDLQQGAVKAATAIDQIDASVKQVTADAPAASTALMTIPGAADASTTALARATGAVTQHTAAVNLNRLQLLEATHIGREWITMLIAGQDPLTAMAVETGRISTFFSVGEGGFTGTLKSAGGAIAGLFTPVVAITSAFAAMAVGAGVAAYSWQKHEDDLKQSIHGVGRATGLTLGQLNDMADAASRRNNIPLGSAIDLTAGFANQGIAPQIISSLTDVSKRYATATRQGIGDVGQDLAQMFAEPTKGADDLQKKLGPLDAATLQLVSTMAREGDVLGAQQVLLRGLQTELQNTADKTDWFTRRWHNVEDIWDRSGRVISSAVAPSLDQKIAAAQQQLAAFTQQSQINQQSGQWMLGRKPGAKSEPDQLQQNISDQIIQLAQLQTQKQQEEQKAKAQATAAAAANASKLIQSITLGAVPDIATVRDLDTKIEGQRKALATPGGLAGSTVSTQQATQALDALTGARANFITTDARARAEEDLAIRSINARTVAEHAAIAAERERVSLSSGQAVSSAEAIKREAAAAAAVIAQANRGATDRLRGANDNNTNALLLPYQRQQSEIAQKYRDTLHNDTGAPDALAKDKAAMQAEIDALNKTSIEGPLRQSTQSLKEQASALHIQADTFGQSTEQIAAATKAQELINGYNQAGIPISDALRESIEAVAGAYGKMAGASEDLQRRQKEVSDAMDAVRGTFHDATSDFISDLRQSGDAGKALSNLLGKTADRATDAVLSNVSDQLFGKSGSTGQGAVGGSLTSWFSDLFGAKSTKTPTIPGLGGAGAIATATISAGTVIVNGTIAGGSGISIPGAAAGTGVTSVSLQPAGYSDLVNAASSKYGVNSNLDMAVLNQESRGDPTLVSKAGAQGLMQLMPGTARDLGVTSPFDPAQNIGGGTQYLSQMLGRYNGDVTRSLVGYNWGPGNADQWNGNMAALPGQTQDYVKNIAKSLGTTTDHLNDFNASVVGTGSSLGSLAGGFDDFGNLPIKASGAGGGGISALLGLGAKFVGSLFTPSQGGQAFSAAAANDLPLTPLSSGGFTGFGSDDTAAGVVHANEYVFSAPATRRLGVPFLEALRRGAKGYAGGGLVGPGSVVNVVPIYPRSMTQGAATSSPPQIVVQPVVYNNMAGAKVTTGSEDDGKGRPPPDHHD